MPAVTSTGGEVRRCPSGRKKRLREQAVRRKTLCFWRGEHSARSGHAGGHLPRERSGDAPLPLALIDEIVRPLLLQQWLAGHAMTEDTADIRADGGASAGAGTAGPGGMIYLFTKDGYLTVHGQLEARGGDAPDTGRTGGQGRFVYVFSGDGDDRMSGILIIAPDRVIDASGGDGTIEGSARTDGKAGSLALWSSRQDDEFDVEETAVLINSDGVHGSDRGRLDNQGKVIAPGGEVERFGRRRPVSRQAAGRTRDTAAWRCRPYERWNRDEWRFRGGADDRVRSSGGRRPLR